MECSICCLNFNIEDSYLIQKCSNENCNNINCIYCSKYINYSCMKCNSKFNFDKSIIDEVEKTETSFNMDKVSDQIDIIENQKENEDYEIIDIKDNNVETDIKEEEKKTYNTMEEAVRKYMIIKLPNIGNSCYINSVLQLFFNCKKLYLELEEAFGKFSHPLDLVQKLRLDYTQELKINIYEQADSSSFLEYILDKINNIMPNKINPIYSLLYHTKLKCKNCNEYVNQRQFNNIMYIQPNLTDTTLEDIIEREFKSNSIEYTCSKCKHNCSKRFVNINNIPRYLFISIQHFGNGVDFSINKELIINNISYTLIGMVERIGMHESIGHYISFVKKHDDKWMLFNDDRVYTCDDKLIDEKLQQNKRMMFQVYICMYEIG
jgi:hypothetical protein